MKPGHHIAVSDIELREPFDAKALPRGVKFDILEVAGDRALLRYGGLRVWKPVADFEKKAVCLLPGQVVADDGYHMVKVSSGVVLEGTATAVVRSVPTRELDNFLNSMLRLPLLPHSEGVVHA